MKVFNFFLLIAIVAASVSSGNAEPERADAKPLPKEVSVEEPSVVQEVLPQKRDIQKRGLFPRRWGYGYGYPYGGYGYGYYGYPYGGYGYYGYPYGAYGYGGYYW
ncbi:hypothetical protein NCLIV_059010 [Neospora caninum Liverpool]|uniref:Uncharacterized protein n=1 Tax=Neospora caninum (strain Liverpool) TaxID=572307 RepID=F0VP31_NEOCL|nr:hypothetical protein NCLIV_059010 [Neospora caninum Liverpool]CBZ55477.1 hypothetical protein NCLIV_059010 [Neospora caninum Liverpool]CEL70214.1 TPA: hypothetical protein BN1204_059010 [Neospora caninum Liverpool]|eukprot:XP_003885505.1 hypothetical protein NCLIV_059010 [Neospora caninum Liverpool]